MYSVLYNYCYIRTGGDHLTIMELFEPHFHHPFSFSFKLTLSPHLPHTSALIRHPSPLSPSPNLSHPTSLIPPPSTPQLSSPYIIRLPSSLNTAPSPLLPHHSPFLPHPFSLISHPFIPPPFSLTPPSSAILLQGFLVQDAASRPE